MTLLVKNGADINVQVWQGLGVRAAGRAPPPHALEGHVYSGLSLVGHARESSVMLNLAC